MRQPVKLGKYQLLERIAVGGMAEVFVAKAFGVEGFERLLAIKRILPTMGEDAEFISMFVDEARIAVQLSHANIVQVLELGKHDDNLYIAMEYISGRDLRQLQERFRKQRQPMPVPQACLIVAEVCEALDYAHRKKDARGVPLGIVHRDVSPQNVLVSFEGEVKLIDFGIAKAESRLQKTQAGILKGKFSYMSPEQVRGQDVDGRSDVFACGILLWEMLCGEKLFSGDSDFAILEKVRNGVVPAPRSVAPHLPEALERVVLKALHPDVRQRYQTASELHDDLKRFTVVGDVMLGSRQLAEWTRDHFRAEHEKEQARLRTWLRVGEGAADAEVTPVDPVRRKQVDAFVAARGFVADFAITPQDPYPASFAQSLIGEAAELPTMKLDDAELAQAERARSSGRPPAAGAPAPPPGTGHSSAHGAEPFDLSNEPTRAVRARRSSPLSRTAKEQEKGEAPRRKARRRLLLALGAPAALAVLAGLGFMILPAEQARPGKLIITPTPSVAAELLIDGKPAGPLPPFVHVVAAGKHRIDVHADGYKPFSTTVTVPAGGRPLDVDVQLQSDGPMEVEGVELKQPKPTEPAREEPLTRAAP